MAEVLNSEAFLIVISGVIIFSFQKILSELWIAPYVVFRKCLSKIEVLILRFAYLSQVAHGVSIRTDEEIDHFRDNLRELTAELMASYNSLPFFMKIWIKHRKKLEVVESKKDLISLSNLVGSRDAEKPTTIASKKIDVIKKRLNFID